MKPPAPPRASGGDVEATLARYRSATRTELLRYLPSKEPRSNLYNLLPQYPLRGGAGVRPALCIAVCGAFGGTVEDAIGSAVALELLHTAFLVHDDIQDGSTERRRGPALHVDHGEPLSLNAGDALVAVSMRPLFDNFTTLGSLAWDVLREFDAMVQETVEGQAIELGWAHRNTLDLGYDDYLHMVTKKTSWYTAIHPSRIGAIIGSRGLADLAPLDRFGYAVGAAFQIRDDVAGHEGRKPGSLRAADDDLMEGKRTLMLVHLLSCVEGRDREDLRRFLARPRDKRHADDAERIRALMDTHKSADFARQCLDAMVTSAADHLETALAAVPESPDTQFLRALVPYMLRP